MGKQSLRGQSKHQSQTQGLGEDKQVESEDFEGSENALYITMAGTHH